MQPRQSGRHIFLLVFYPLLITKGAIFKHFIHDLRQFPHMRLILVALFACLTTLEQIVHRNSNFPYWLMETPKIKVHFPDHDKIP